jgi:hypothetical protein
MVRIRSTTLFVTLSVTVLILIYTTFQNLLPSFAETQNSTTQNITQGIPTTISKEAQEELQKVTFDPSHEIPRSNRLERMERAIQ